MSYVNPNALVETDWLVAHFSDAKVKVLDASFHLPGTGRDAETEFGNRHIPGAALFDIEDVRDRDIALPHMLPSAGPICRADGHARHQQWRHGRRL